MFFVSYFWIITIIWTWLFSFPLRHLAEILHNTLCIYMLVVYTSTSIYYCSQYRSPIQTLSLYLLIAPSIYVFHLLALGSQCSSWLQIHYLFLITKPNHQVPHQVYTGPLSNATTTLLLYTHQYNESNFIS